MRVSILARPGSMLPAISGLADMFRIVNQAWLGRPEEDWLSSGRPIF
ncbi:hypothetical protein DZA65_03425 [Dickeya dianthicola]|nr:hypothetical protein DZA65_03425 [Dickeya dianthicola]